jgi:hypothetical protein
MSTATQQCSPPLTLQLFLQKLEGLFFVRRKKNWHGERVNKLIMPILISGQTH